MTLWLFSRNKNLKTSAPYHQLHGLEYSLSLHNISRFKTGISRKHKKICYLSTINLNEKTSQSEQHIPRANPASANLCKIVSRDYLCCCSLEHCTNMLLGYFCGQQQFCRRVFHSRFKRTHHKRGFIRLHPRFQLVIQQTRTHSKWGLPV